MVKRVKDFFNKEIQGLHEAAYLLASFAFLSQILALVRDRLFASTFGASELLDVYYAAFRIPDIIFVVVGALVSVSVLVPFLVQKMEKEKDSVQQFVHSVFTVLVVGTLVLVIGAFCFARPLLTLLVPELVSGEHGDMLVLVTRLLLIQPIFLSFSSLFSSIVQVYRKFFIYALSPLLYNLGIIAGVMFLYPLYGLVGLAYGVIIGAILHFVIQIPTVAEHKMLPRLTTNIDWKAVKSVLVLSLPRTCTLAGTHFTSLIFLAIAGTMIAGSISIFSLAFNLQSVPLSIIGVSYSLAAFPTLSKLFTNGQTDLFLGHIIRSARHIIFWSFPITILFIVLRAQIVRVIFGAGSFDWNDTRLTAASLALFAVSVLAQSLILLFVRGYYSAGQTKKPLLMAFVAFIVSVVSAFALVHVFNTTPEFKFFVERLMRVENIPGTVVLMLPLAYTLGQLVNVGLLWSSFSRQFKDFSTTLWRTMFQSFSASLIMGYASFKMLQVLDDVFDINTLSGIFFQGFIAGIVGIIVAIVVLVLLKNREVATVWQTLHKKIWKTKLVAVEQDEM